MKQLPTKNYTGGLQPFTANRHWNTLEQSEANALVGDIQSSTWNNGIGDDNDAKGGIFLAEMNGFLSECCLRSCLEELGYYPGTFFYDPYENHLLMFQVPTIISFPVVSTDTNPFLNTIPVPTRWNRDCLIPNYAQNQTNSPLGFKITMSALPVAGEKGQITGSDIVSPSAGWLIIDTKIVVDDDVDVNNSMQIWLRVSNVGNSSMSEIHNVSDPDESNADFLIFDNGFPVQNMIPVSKGANLSLFASVSQNVTFKEIYFNLRLLSPEDVSEWS